MAETKLSEIMELKQKSLSQLREKYKELYCQNPPSSNKVFLWRKIAYRIQELTYGGLAKETQTKIQELIQKYDPVNNAGLRPDKSNEPMTNKKPSRDRRLPIPGTIITKEYKNKKLEVKILESGFEYNSKVYKSLSAIAKEVSGAHWNGYLFFNI